ncbi:MAG: tetratricopeptide repeat protein, partial [Myxococcota bacterium]|nr:tetratricopeptide repeat protein [Myxococcota bacterium]
AYVGLGIGLSRLGKDEEARQNLEKAFEGDPYNVRTYNMLRFFYDGPIKEFEWVDAGPARFRLHRGERLVLSRVMPPLVQEAWDHLVAKYGVTPPSPVHIEVFPDPETFAVRSIGLPDLGAHGICFGQVITSRSPKTGDFNWAEVLWHELSHVFHIHLSKRRVPRWFTEGLAVYEATEGRPEWRREMDATLLDYREAGKLRGVAEFNLSFTRARSMADILVAYYHASRVAEFIATTHGWKATRRMLETWGEGKETSVVFKEALGQETLAAFDARFDTWLDGKLAHLTKSLRLPVARLAPRAPALGKAADKTPGDLNAQVQAAIAWFGQGDTEKALNYADRAMKLQPDEPRARLVRALVLQQGGELDGAEKGLQGLLKHGHDGVEVRRALAELSRNQGKGAVAVEHLERAIAIDPQEGELYHMVVALLDGLKESGRAYMWRRRALAIDQASASLIGALLEGARQNKATRD